MTRSDIAKLSDEEANKLIAIAMGYKVEKRNWEQFPFRLINPSGRAGNAWMSEEAAWTHGFPSYCSDLNACTKLQENASSNYWHQLADDIGCRQYGSDILQAFRLIGIATARQRALAFIMTLELDKTPSL